MVSDDDKYVIFRYCYLEMDSSDEDFLPDPERFREDQASSLMRNKELPDREDANKQRGLNLHDDFMKGKCFLFSK